MRTLVYPQALKAFAADRRGTVTIFSAALIAALIAVISLVGEYGLTLERQNEDQRIADAATFAAANYYGQHSDDTGLAMARTIAQNVAALNGAPASGVTLNLGASPSDSTKSALKVTVTTSSPLFLSEVISHARTTLTTQASSYAQYGSSSVPACITALSSTSGIALSGGTAISAPQCGISTNATLTVPCGTRITALGVSYGGSAPSQCSSSANIVNASGTALSTTHATVTDPLASNSGVVAAESHVATVALLTSPAAPSAPATVAATGTGGTTVSFNLGWSPTTTQSSGGCTATYGSIAVLGNVTGWTISCPAGHTYNFTTFTVAGSMNAALVTTGTGSTTFNFPNAVSMSYSSWSMAAGNYNFLNGLTMAGTTATFQGAGNIYVSNGLNITGSGTNKFTGPGSYYISGGLTLSGGANTFAVSGSFVVNGGYTASGSASAVFTGNANYTFNNGFSNSGSATASFSGAGNYTFVNGLTQNSGSALTFSGSGVYAFGPTASCNSSNYSICVTNSGVLTFSGTDTFTLSNGIYVSGGDTLVMGSGTANSYNIGRSGAGNVVSLGGGAKLTFADATGSSSLFQMVGNVNVDSGGGSCMVLGAATNHDINGSFATAGGTILGAGTYTLNGSLSYGNNGGGSVTCNGSTVGLKGTGVTFIYNAASTPSSGTCSGKGVCFTAGFSNVFLSAPTTGTYANLLFVGPQTGSSAGVLFSGGATANMSGAFYEPLGVFTMTGGASINSVSTASWTGGCFQIVALSVSMSGGTTAASSCVTSSVSSSSLKFVM